LDGKHLPMFRKNNASIIRVGHSKNTVTLTANCIATGE